MKHLFMTTATLLLCGAAWAQNTVTIAPAAPALDTTPDVYRSTSKIGSNAASLQACIDAIKADAATRAPGTYAYSCRPGITSITATVAAPPPCPAKPADETRTQQCPAGTTGSWTQTRTYASAPQPACWTAGEWLPAAAPAGACVTPPPPPPPPPAGSSLTIEAETGAVAGGANKQAVGGAASGGSIAAIFGSGASISWTVDAGAGGAATVAFRYANAGSAASLELYVNGTRQTTVAFSGTGSWNSFANTAAAAVTLVAGSNTLMVRRDAGDSGAVDFDTLTVTLSTGTPPPPPPPPPPPAIGTATLQWDAVADARVIGYRVYFGTAPRSYSQAYGAGLLVTGTSYTVPALAAGATYYFAVTAVAEGLESGYSNEASKAIP